jgi:hypothetical protein
MSKERKTNKETKKSKATSDGSKKQKKDPKRHDGSVSGLFGDRKGVVA